MPCPEKSSSADLTVWAGMAAPAGTPREAINALWAAAAIALGSLEVRQALTPFGFVEPLDPEAFAVYIGAETAKGEAGERSRHEPE